MDAVVVEAFGGPEQASVVQVPVPRPAAGQVRIRVRAAGLNPVDGAVRAGVFGGSAPLGLGWDVAGEIDEVGEGVTGWTAGARVVALHYGPFKELGTHAEYVVLDADAVAPAPESVTAVEAAALPLSGLTAARALDQLGLVAGQSVLVTGAAGMVGGFAVQLAAAAGLVVTAVAGPQDEELVRGLGAAEFVARGSAPAEPVDGVLDAAVVGEEALAFARDGGAYVGLHPGSAPASVRGVRVSEQEVAADGTLLSRLSALVDQGALTLRVAATYPLADSSSAHLHLTKPGTRGRVVLTVA
ncbi:NADP-dependent oxidoreductase [Streptomyces antimicrobicus]|uniref:NADP-dependent oxidoreductase n=1 Tax=Streptomyces antimicrobicus TaxID=2883108 RepID=A0ABS8B2X7_9ACTN|nr:NADP-dependent oxidoreductase [Streptomyces antimicrobicus]MCB5178961.1 NADP-dependent oxidoreductase [Streptomyces antimicrobicus]